MKSLVGLYIVCLMKFILVQSQETTPNPPTLSPSSQTAESNTSFTTIISKTTEFVPRDILDPSLPMVRQLRKKSAKTTEIVISFSPPTNFRNDARYTHFRITYGREGSDRIPIRKPKRDIFPDRVIIPGLQPGVLYRLSVRTEGRDSDGNYLLSRPQTIAARTKPLPPKNLRVAPLEDTINSVQVIWDGDPTPLNGPKYDEFILRYEIITKPGNFNGSKQVIIPHRRSVFNPLPVINVTRIITDLELGAGYKFSIKTKSLGDDSTESTSVIREITIMVPGPEDLKKTKYNTTSITVEWQNHPTVTGITGHVLFYTSVATPGKKGERSDDIVLSSDEQSYTITDLQPGILYLISVYSLRSTQSFGTETKTAVLYARTLPASPEGMTVGNVTKNTALVSLNLPQNITASTISIRYEDVNTEVARTELVRNLQVKRVVISNLKAGALYRFTILVVSKVGLQYDETESSTQYYARTIPNSPKKFVGSGTQGKILLRWVKPDGVERPTSWNYEIVYYPRNNPAQTRRENLWNRGGVSQMTHSLSKLLPGTQYEILLYCDVGKDSEENRKTRSLPAGPLTIYTQPKNPIITDWIQVTLKHIRLSWTSPGNLLSNFDYYILNLTRIYKRGSAVEYEPESYTYDIEKEKTTKVLKLSVGATYRVILTAAVGEGDSFMQSVVNASNNRVFETWSPYDSHQAFRRLKWIFTNCGEIGRLGPSQEYCSDAYEDTSLDNLVIVEQGIQQWMAPMEGLYRITATGAGYLGPGGKGATVSGLFNLKEGSGLKIAVGQIGDYSGDMVQGGAGGTFVVADDSGTNEPIVIAGGAGTSSLNMAPSETTNGRLNHTAADASSFGQGFGYGGRSETRGPGLPGIANTAGGAGYEGISRSAVRFGDVESPAVGFLPFGSEKTMNESEKLMYVPLSGGRYASDTGFSEGGFGGGGSGYINAPGGGGGYTGGGGGPVGGYSGGGGSYIKFTGGIQYAEVTNIGPGVVEITLVGIPVSSPVPVTLYLIVAFFVGIGMTLCCGGMIFGVDKCAGRYLIQSKKEEEVKSPTVIKHEFPSSTWPPPKLADNMYETSVHVTDVSPTTSGLYVRNIPDETDNHSYRKYSEVDSIEYMPPIDPVKSLSEFDHQEAIDSPSPRPLLYTDGIMYEEGEEVSDDEYSESTASSIPSMRSDIQYSHEALGWSMHPIEESEEETDSQSSSSSEESNSENDEVARLPPPPPPPPMEELIGEQQRKNFRKSLNKFHDMENQH